MRELSYGDALDAGVEPITYRGDVFSALGKV